MKVLFSFYIVFDVHVHYSISFQTAAEMSARLDTGMEYPAEVGVNAYVKVSMSFTGREVSLPESRRLIESAILSFTGTDLS